MMRGNARTRKGSGPRGGVDLEWREEAAGIKTKKEEKHLNDTATYHDNKLALIGNVVHQLNSQDESQMCRRRSTIFVDRFQVVRRRPPAQTHDSDRDVLGRPAL